MGRQRRNAHCLLNRIAQGRSRRCSALLREYKTLRKRLADIMAANNQAFYELYRGSSIGLALTDTLDDLIAHVNPEVWTFLIKNVTFKMDHGHPPVTADKIKIVSCN